MRRAALYERGVGHLEPSDTTSANGSYSLGGTAETLRGEIVLDPSAHLGKCVDDIGPCVDSYTGLCQRTALVGTGIATSMSWATGTDLAMSEKAMQLAKTYAVSPLSTLVAGLRGTGWRAICNIGNPGTCGRRSRRGRSI